MRMKLKRKKEAKNVELETTNVIIGSNQKEKGAKNLPQSSS